MLFEGLLWAGILSVKTIFQGNNRLIRRKTIHKPKGMQKQCWDATFDMPACQFNQFPQEMF